MAISLTAATVVGVAALALTGCSTDTVSRFTLAQEVCTDTLGRTAMAPIEVKDDGKSLIISTKDDKPDLTGVACVLHEIGTREATISRMDGTTSLMGEVSADEGTLNYVWSYHPDNGINIVVTDTE